VSAASELHDDDSGRSGVVGSWLIGVIVGGVVLLIVIGIVVFGLRRRVRYTMIEVSTEEESNEHIHPVTLGQTDERYITQEGEMSSDVIEGVVSVADDDDELVKE
jgi:ABC-type lipoprotein release transport system permease subunit